MAKISNKTIQLVNSFENLTTMNIYQSTNYDLFKPIKFNRGQKCGFSPKKVAEFVKLINEGKFYHDTIHVTLNLNNEMIDGNSRFVALKQTGHPINFYFTAEEGFNKKSNSEKIEEVSFFNSTNPVWKGKEAYDTALLNNYPIAKLIEELTVRIKVIGANSGYKNKIVRYSQLFAFINDYKVKGLTTDRAVNFYNRPDLVEKFKKENYLNVLDNMIKITILFKKTMFSNFRIWNSLRAIREHELLTGSRYNWDLLYKVAMYVSTKPKYYNSLTNDVRANYKSLAHLLIELMNDTKLIKKIG